jgi:hypothetical protein
MALADLTILILGLNLAIFTGTSRSVRSRTTSGWAILFNWLGKRFSGRTDFSLLNATPESAEAIMERLQALLDC